MFFKKSMPFLCSFFVFFASCEKKNSYSHSVGVIVPMEHKAMTSIVEGLQESLSKEVPDVQIVVKNAQGDENIQRSLIAQMKSQGFQVLAPIATDPALMVLSMDSQTPVVAIAAEISEEDRKKQKPCHVAVVDDTISVHQSLAFLRQAFPHVQKIALIHSASDKIFPEVQDSVQWGRSNNLVIEPKLVQSLPDIYSVVQSLPKDIQGIFILKDSLIVSGIAALQKAAVQRHLFLMTSDQGSVQTSAGFAIGVHEKEIGQLAGHQIALLFQGQKACDLPIEHMDKLITVFVNKKALEQEGVDSEVILKTAAQNHQKVEVYP